jgi:hypothetical protein
MPRPSRFCEGFPDFGIGTLVKRESICSFSRTGRDRDDFYGFLLKAGVRVRSFFFLRSLVSQYSGKTTRGKRKDKATLDPFQIHWHSPGQKTVPDKVKRSLDLVFTSNEPLSCYQLSDWPTSEGHLKFGAKKSSS